MIGLELYITMVYYEDNDSWLIASWFLFQFMSTYMFIYYPQIEIPVMIRLFANYLLGNHNLDMQMAFILGCNFNILYHVLLDVVVQCKRYDWSSWITKCVIFTNESGLDVVREICRNINADLVINSDGLPQGDDRIDV